MKVPGMIVVINGFPGAGKDTFVKPNGHNKFVSLAKNCEFVRFEDAKHEIYIEKDEIFENKQIVKKYLKEGLPIIKLVECDSTYLLWLDCSALNVPSKVFPLISKH